MNMSSSCSSSALKKKSVFPILVLVLASTAFFPFSTHAHIPQIRTCNFDLLLQFGDSHSDTGNLMHESPNTPYAKLPYGESFFVKYTNHKQDRLIAFVGRASDGFLMIDVFSLLTGLDFMVPYEKTGASLGNGVNFAVGGATALPTEVLAAKNISSLLTNSSLSVQLDWLSDYLNSTCPTHRDCVEKLQNALFMVGPIGETDYRYAILQGKTKEELKCMVTEVVNATIDAVRKSINWGAAKVVVPGLFPMGCFPLYKTVYETNITEAYDENHCLKEFNEFAMYHNQQLEQAIDNLKQERPNAMIMYGDYYQAYLHLLEESKPRDEYFLGYDTEYTCCGIGGKYNFNVTRMCGTDPGVMNGLGRYSLIHWDGVHLTEQGYSVIADWLMDDIVTKFQCNLH